MSLERKIESAKEILLQANNIAENGFKFLLFSGGKDSIVVSHLAKKTIGLLNAFSEDSILTDQTRKEIFDVGVSLGLNVHYNTRLTPKVFAKHMKNNLPPVKWKPSDLDSIRHWKSIPKYAKETNATMMVFGRRKEENTIPKPIYYKSNFKPLQVHPIWDWTFNDVWEYISTNNLKTPTCYKDGSKHLLTWISIAQNIYKDTGNLKLAYDSVYKHAPEYMIEARNINKVVDDYLKAIHK